ncbi:GNAT family N-acetyltransferase [Saccharospirillum impatiens]|uniref:GNAT family N-acetyltransferase n=1 Tax=Saccharospirillum impatiens TaxID=169438 RepID=UPI0006847F79|nr:GNAT family N-acetyltransferase [Saccharospirillum impatiens]
MMNHSLIIREACPSDAESLSALCITVWIDTYSTEGLHPSHATYVLTEYTPELLVQRMSVSDVTVVERDGCLIGFAVFNEHTGEIETFYILTRFKGMGIGARLLEALKAKYDERLFLSCWENNAAALGFYLKKGFVESGETFFELDGEQHRNVILELRI